MGKGHHDPTRLKTCDEVYAPFFVDNNNDKSIDPAANHQTTTIEKAAFNKTAEQIYANILQGVYDPGNDVRAFSLCVSTCACAWMGAMLVPGLWTRI